MALGKALYGSFTSSAIFAISSNPIYAKKIKAVEENTAVRDAAAGNSK
jgi:hypothetical protein